MFNIIYQFSQPLLFKGIKACNENNDKIIMWSVLSFDFITKP